MLLSREAHRAKMSLRRRTQHARAGTIMEHLDSGWTQRNGRLTRDLYSGVRLRAIRAEKGVGRPPGTLSVSAGVLAKMTIGEWRGMEIITDGPYPA